MAALNWSEELALQQVDIDATHREFVSLLADLEAVDPSDNSGVSAKLSEFIQHTEHHFAQEEDWMARMGFEPNSCHHRQHASVLAVLREVQRRIDGQGEVTLIPELVPALVEWFTPHARNMDGGLIEAMALTGFDPRTGAIARTLEALA